MGTESCLLLTIVLIVASSTPSLFRLDFGQIKLNLCGVKSRQTRLYTFNSDEFDLEVLPLCAYTAHRPDRLSRCSLGQLRAIVVSRYSARMCLCVLCCCCAFVLVNDGWANVDAKCQFV